MLQCFDFARNLDFIAIFTRLSLAVICGGLIGIERELKRRPAGFRTHILICIGAAITTLTSQYLYLEMHLFTDVARLGAQVIAGIGFIGAGTIIVTRNKNVKGLTTAAGLWTAAIIGLVCGAGYVECAVVSTLVLLFAELVLIRVEYKLAKNADDINLYVEYESAQVMEKILSLIRSNSLSVSNMEITRSESDKENDPYYCALISIRASKKYYNNKVSEKIREQEGIRQVEEF